MKAGRSGSWWALLGILVLVAHASLFGVGPVGNDFEVLVESSRAVHSEGGGESADALEHIFGRAGTNGRPLAAWSLGMSTWIWTSGGHWTTFAASGMRFENLLLLGLVAFLLSRFLRRLLLPWTDSEQASAASYAVFMLLLVHPLSVSAVASPAARGDLLGACFALLASLAFLKGRQDRRFGLVAVAALATALATQASELGYAVPIWLALIEYSSSRRHRSTQARIRTCVSTLIIFGAIAGLDIAMRIGLGIDPWPSELQASLLTLTSFQESMYAIYSGLTKLGVLILPVNGANAGALGFVFAALILVAVIQPVLHASRSAPRFWIMVLCIWLALVLFAEAMRATLDVGPNDFSASAGMFPAVIIMAVGLSVASTAVSGTRRQSVPLVVAFLLCSLARSNARGWRSAAKDARRFSTELSASIAKFGSDPTYYVIDSSGLSDLYAATPLDLGWIFDEAFSGEKLRAEELRFHHLTEAGFLNFARLEEFDVARSKGLVALFPNRLVNPGARTHWVSEELSSAPAAGRVQEWRNPSAAEASGGHWLAQDGAQPFVANSASIEVITVKVKTLSEGTERDNEAAEIYWRARGGVVQGGKLSGPWFESDGGRQAIFDTGSSISWLLGPRVDSLLLMGDLAETAGASVLPSPPLLDFPVEPEIDDDDWHLGVLPEPEPEQDQPDSVDSEPTPLSNEWYLTLLDLQSYEFVEILCELDDDRSLNAPDAEEISQRLRQSPGSLAWGVEHRIDGALIARSGGRL